MVVVEHLRRLSFKLYVSFSVINYSDFVGLRHSGCFNSPDVSGTRPCSCMCWYLLSTEHSWQL